ncbi:MAG: GNAT family N-acetyltransferase [Planctomycetota bacterium]|nr:GNAT family N-acetyltransferase [Planctomycetota bacterium]
MDQPSIETDRLILRPFTVDDAPDVQRLAGDRAVADTTLLIPHPYPDGLAEDWITTHRPVFQAGEGAVFAITRRDDGALVGAIGLSITPAHQRAEMGYWVGRPYWNQGYATEAAAAALDYGFHTLRLNRVHAHHFARNPASGRVLEKIGMKAEGVAPQHVKKKDRFEDLALYGLCRDEYDTASST